MKKRLEGLDFLRVIALFSILFYHIDGKSLPGGFLGVEIFYVIFGYLLMHSLIFKRKNYTIKTYFKDLLKRIKRILPELILMVAGVVLFLFIFNKDYFKLFYKDGLSSLTFTSNWKFIFEEVDYFDSFKTSPFKHTWYLSLQEQLYLIMPLIFLLLNKIDLKYGNKHRALKIGLFALMGLSLASLILRFDPNNINRVYYGTDTRAFEIIFGMLLYLYLPINKVISITGQRKVFFNLLGLVSIGLFLVLIFKISEFSFWLYRGGFLLINLLAAVMVVAIGGSFTRISRTPLVRYLSRLSYSAYLWHFPVIVLSQSQREILGPNPYLVVFRIGLTFFLSAISYELFHAVKNRRERDRYLKALKFCMGLSSLAIVIGLVTFTATSAIADRDKENKQVGSHQEESGETEEGKGQEEKDKDNKKQTDDNKKPEDDQEKANPKPGKSQEEGQDNQEGQESGDPEQAGEEGDKKPEDGENTEEGDKKPEDDENSEEEEDDRQAKKYENFILVGDSITEDITQDEFDSYFPGGIVDGKINRQMYQAVDVVEKYKDYDSESTCLVFELGINGIFSKEQMEDLINSMPKSDKYFLTTFGSFKWEKIVNDLMVEVAEDYDNVMVLDWHNFIKDHTDGLEPDHTHLNHNGRMDMLNFIKENISGVFIEKPLE